MGIKHFQTFPQSWRVHPLAGIWNVSRWWSPKFWEAGAGRFSKASTSSTRGLPRSSTETSSVTTSSSPAPLARSKSETWVWQRWREPLLPKVSLVSRQSVSCTFKRMQQQQQHFAMSWLHFSRYARVYGPGDVRGALWWICGCLRIWDVHAWDGHLRVPLFWVSKCCPDLSKSHQCKLRHRAKFTLVCCTPYEHFHLYVLCCEILWGR